MHVCMYFSLCGCVSMCGYVYFFNEDVCGFVRVCVLYMCLCVFLHVCASFEYTCVIAYVDVFVRV